MSYDQTYANCFLTLLTSPTNSPSSSATITPISSHTPRASTTDLPLAHPSANYTTSSAYRTLVHGLQQNMYNRVCTSGGLGPVNQPFTSPIANYGNSSEYRELVHRMEMGWLEEQYRAVLDRIEVVPHMYQNHHHHHHVEETVEPILSTVPVPNANKYMYGIDGADANTIGYNMQSKVGVRRMKSFSLPRNTRRHLRQRAKTFGAPTRDWEGPLPYGE